MKSKTDHSNVNLHGKLRERYKNSGEWATAYEVGDKTGGSRRRCDFMAFNMWPSKGLVLHGHEIKHSRSDWKKELDDPSKSEAISRYCNYWWIVAPKGIVKLDELPTDWGLMEATEKSALRVQKMAAKKDSVEWPRAFVASLFRAVADYAPGKKLLNDEYRRGYSEGSEHSSKTWETRTESFKTNFERRVSRAETRIKEFEDASGVQIEGWNAKRQGESFKRFQECQFDNVRQIANSFVALADAIDAMQNEARSEATS